MGWEPEPHALPARLRSNALLLPSGRAWRAGLADHLHRVMARWSLVHDADAGTWWARHSAVVVPVLSETGRPLALKASIPDDDLLTEAWALEIWAGDGAVRMLRHEGFDLLLERLAPDADLGAVPMEEACGHWGALMARLSLPADPVWPPFGRTDALAERWNDEFPADWEELGRPFPRSVLEAALDVCQYRGAVSRRDSDDFLVHADLNYHNVLARPSGGYAAIDPQGIVGDREFAVLPMLHNRLGDLPPRNQAAALRGRLRILGSAAGIDAGLAAAWSVARAVEDTLWFTRHGRAPDAERSLWVATALAGLDVSHLPAASDLKPLVQPGAGAGR